MKTFYEHFSSRTLMSITYILHGKRNIEGHLCSTNLPRSSTSYIDAWLTSLFSSKKTTLSAFVITESSKRQIKLFIVTFLLQLPFKRILLQKESRKNKTMKTKTDHNTTISIDESCCWIWPNLSKAVKTQMVTLLKTIEMFRLAQTVHRLFQYRKCLVIFCQDWWVHDSIILRSTGTGCCNNVQCRIQINF